MRSLLWLPGLFLIALVIHDLLKNTVQEGDGVLGHVVNRLVYRLLHGLAVRTRQRGFLAWIAPAIIVSNLLSWTLLLWLGWTLVFWSSPDSLVGADGQRTVNFWNVAYFIGYTLSTLGLGDLKPVQTSWRLLTDVAALCGFINLTFAVTFMVPVVQARQQRREFARLIHRRGPDAQALVVKALTDHPNGLQSVISDMHVALNMLDTKHHHAHYLHCFHDERRPESFSLALPALGEAALIARCALPGPPPPGLGLSHALIDSLVRGHAAHCPGPLPPVPPPPSLSPLRRAGIATLSEAEFGTRLAEYAEHRQYLRAMVEEGLWSWDDVSRPAPHDRAGPRAQ